MRRVAILVAATLGAIVALGALLWFNSRRQDPRALLEALAHDPGNRQELIMRLNVSRGDVVEAMLEALQRPKAPAAFRVDVLELLMKQDFRRRNERIQQAVRDRLADSDAAIRRKAAEVIVTYGHEPLQAALADCLDDSDAQVRRQAYIILTAGRPQEPDQGPWQYLTEPQKQRMLQVCLARASGETDAEMRLLARSVLGREMEVRIAQARQAAQTADVGKAEQLLQSCLTLDADSRMPKIALARFYLRSDRKDAALQHARRCGALIEAPQLSAAPQIDGDPTEEAWKGAWSSNSFVRTSSKWVERPAEGRSAAFIGHRDGSLYIAVIGYEEDVGQLIMQHSARDSEVYLDDCVEIVLDPANTERDFYKFIINPAGVLLDRFGMDKTRNFVCRYKAAVFPDRKYWACEFAIDGKELGNHPIASGDLWTLNLFRVRIGGASEHATIWPTFGDGSRQEYYPLVLFK